MNLKFGDVPEFPLNEDDAWSVTRVRLADRFKWSFSYIDDELTHDDLLVINGVDEADKLMHPTADGAGSGGAAPSKLEKELQKAEQLETR